MSGIADGFRCHRVQVAGLVVVLALGGTFVWLAGRDAAGPRPAAAVTTPRPSPTADPRIAEFKARTLQFLNLIDDSGRTGNAAEADPMIYPGSSARGNAGVKADISIKNGRNFLVSTLNVDEQSWKVHIGAAVTVDMDYMVTGHEAEWPSLHPLEADHPRGPFHTHLEFEQYNGQWLITAFGA